MVPGMLPSDTMKPHPGAVVVLTILYAASLLPLPAQARPARIHLLLARPEVVWKPCAAASASMAAMVEAVALAVAAPPTPPDSAMACRFMPPPPLHAPAAGAK